jgi:hypothetical protein
MPSGIQALPIEILYYVVQELDMVDLFNWSLTCQQFHYLIRDPALCRDLLEVRRPYIHSAITYARHGVLFIYLFLFVFNYLFFFSNFFFFFFFFFGGTSSFNN